MDTATLPTPDFAAFLRTGRANLHNIPEWQHQLVFAVADWLTEDGGGEKSFTLDTGGSGAPERLAAALRILGGAKSAVPTLTLRSGYTAKTAANFVELRGSGDDRFHVSVAGRPKSNVYLTA